jgi:hypothetical protein
MYYAGNKHGTKKRTAKQPCLKITTIAIGSGRLITGGEIKHVWKIDKLFFLF